MSFFLYLRIQRYSILLCNYRTIDPIRSRPRQRHNNTKTRTEQQQYRSNDITTIIHQQMEEQNNCITETTIGRQHNNNAYTPAEQNNCITGTTMGRQHNNNASHWRNTTTVLQEQR